MQHRVIFRPSGKEVSVESGTKVSEAARLAGVEIATPCGGTGRCGRCTVLIDGDFEDRVLACMTQVDRDMTVTIPERDSGRVIAATDDKHLDIDELSPMTSGLGLAVDIGTKAMGIYMLAWTLFTVLMFIATLRLVPILTLIFGTAVIGFTLLTIADFTGEAIVTQIAGFVGTLLACEALYGGVAQVINEVYGREFFPIGVEYMKKKAAKKAE